MDKILDENQQAFLLRAARTVIESRLRTGKWAAVDSDDPVLKEKRGAFVTLHVHGQLRGCIGYPLPIKPLLETIVEMAIAASSQDTRFQPVGLDELEMMTVEISVLSLPRKVEDVSEVEVGRHGIIISKGGHRGLLLPQVPGEWNWDRETYLSHGCLKAGLPEDEWKKGAAIEVFTAQVFSE